MQTTHFRFVGFGFGFHPSLVHVHVLFDIGEAGDVEGVLCVEGMAVHGYHGVCCILSIFERGEQKSAGQLVNYQEPTVLVYTPFALSRTVIPRQVHIIGLNGCSFLPELLRDPRQQLLQLRLVDDGDTIYDQEVV